MIQNYGCATAAGVAAHIRYYDPPCRICKEWLAKVEAGEASKPAPIKAPKKPVAKRSRKPVVCGTTAAYHQHYARGEEVDEKCLEAYRVYRRESYAERKQGRPAPRAKRTDPIEHGTAKGRGQHKRRGEEPCTPCREAYNADNAAKRAARLAVAGKTTTPKPIICGTLRAYRDHRAKGEEACQPCKDANRQAKADYRERTGNR